MQMLNPEVRPLVNMADRPPSHEFGHPLGILTILDHNVVRLSCRKRGEMGVDQGIQQQERLVQDA
jgi:hypothetical protein